MVIIYNAERRATEIGSTKITSLMKLFASSTRNFPNFVFHGVSLTGPNAENLWNRIGGHVEHLTISACQITSMELVKFLKDTPHLSSLAFTKMHENGKLLNKWRANDFEELKMATNITNLRWDDDIEIIIKDNIFKALIGITKPAMLESLSLGNVRKMNFPYPFFQNLLGDENTVNQLLIKDIFEEFLTQHHQGLKSLEIVDTLRDCVIKALIQTKQPLALEKLKLRNFSCATELTLFLGLQINLKELYLANVTADNDTMDVIAKMQNLESLIIEQNAAQSMDDAAIQLLHRFKHLKVGGGMGCCSILSG
jgi:hypothetical protein